MNSPNGRTWRTLVQVTVALTVVGVGGCGSMSRDVSTTSGRVVKDGSTSIGGGDSRRPPQDDNHITVYGHEASGSERESILRLLKRYYAAAAADDGRTACTMLHDQLARSVVEDYGQLPANRGKTCAAVMKRVFRHLAGQPPVVLAHTRVTGIRISGGGGFAQLHSSAMATGEIALTKDGTAWKVAVLIGRVCKDCAPASS